MTTHEDIIGCQPLGFPGARIVKVEPTVDYLVHGPVGDGWYDSTEKRFVVTDFIVTVKLEDGRTVEFPKSYDYVTNGIAAGKILKVKERI
jgi:hypothetical protein